MVIDDFRLLRYGFMLLDLPVFRGNGTHRKYHKCGNKHDSDNGIGV